jgi:hypothetical protein
VEVARRNTKRSFEVSELKLPIISPTNVGEARIALKKPAGASKTMSVLNQSGTGLKKHTSDCTGSRD